MNTQQRLLQRHEVSMLLGLLALGLSFRLIKISQPFVDGWSWRQADVAMIAENFYRHGFHIFYPQINWGGSSPGYVGTEFPLVPFIASLLYVLFGVHDWIGRSVSIFFFALSVPFLYLLIRRISNAQSGLFGVGMYVFAPLSIFTSRSFMPDMASLSFSLAALYLFAEWLEHESEITLFIAVSAATSLAILVKLPAIIIGLPLSYMAWEKYGGRFILRGKLWAFAALSLIFPLAWYVHAYLISTSHFPYHFFGEGGIRIETLGWYRGILYWTVTDSLTPIVSAAMLVGIVVSARGKSGFMFHWWLAAIILFVVMAGHGNRHQWYQLPIVPVAAAFAGITCDSAFVRLSKCTGSRTVLLLACLLWFAALASLSYLYLRPYYAHQRPSLWKVGTELNRIAPGDALVVVADDGDPRAIYYSNRKGWHFLHDGRLMGYPSDSRQAIALLEKLRKEGASYLAFPEDAFWWFDHYKEFRGYLDSRYQRMRDTKAYIIYELSVAKTE